MQQIRRLGAAAGLLGAMLTFATVAGAQAKSGTSKAPGKSAAPALHWGPAPDAFPKGAKMAVESGDPSKAGEYAVRLSIPKGYKIQPHFHPTDEHVRVVKGQFMVGMGDKLDASKTKKMAPGDTGTVPAQMHHFAIAGASTELAIRGTGPFTMTYVNAADDPRKKK